MSYTTPEQHVQQPIIKFLNELEDAGYPIMHQRREAAGSTYKKGSADIWFTWGPYHIEVEVKAPGGTLSTMQEKWLRKCQIRGIPCWVIDDPQKFKNLIYENFINKKD